MNVVATIFQSARIRRVKVKVISLPMWDPKEFNSEIPRGVREGGGLRKLSQIARQISEKLLVLCLVHRTKGAHNCCKFKSQCRTANTPFPMPPSQNF